jgi:hypothetical protein
VLPLFGVDDRSSLKGHRSAAGKAKKNAAQAARRLRRQNGESK